MTASTIAKADDSSIELALKKYRKKEVSIGRAAEIANMPVADMLRIAAEKKILIHYTKEDLLKDFKAAKKRRSN